VIDHCEFRKPQREAILLGNVKANPPLRITQGRFHADGRDAPAVLLKGGLVQGVRLTECRFDGGFRAGLEVTTECRDVEIAESRFSKVIDCVRYVPDSPVPFQAVIRNNTFKDAEHGLFLEVAPPSSGEGLRVIDNLFSNCKLLASLDRVNGQPSQEVLESVQWIWHDEKKKDANAPMPAETRWFRQVIDLPSLPPKVLMDIGVDETFKVWINGKEVGKSTTPYYAKRIYAYDVTKYLVMGPNVIAIEAGNKLDPLNNGYGTGAGVMVRLVAGDKVLGGTDANWKTSAERPPADWTKPGSESGSWKPAFVFNKRNPSATWVGAVWDSVVMPQFGSKVPFIPIEAMGNVRDYYTFESYPLLNAMRGTIPMAAEELRGHGLGANPNNDAEFLRYLPSSPLAMAGHAGGPVGASPSKTP
jgi:hypothetical protein